MCATTPNTPALLRCCPKRYEAPVKARQTDGVDLVRRIQAGDQPAFRALVERHQSRIFRIICGILHNRADAEE
ncbi:MAG TPA: hypothetical protein VN648_29650, partial [Candidatus Methylomirabilis sp.]|nr:hypothetical protein [Candidatus Methylomirabilis sp.]